MKILLLSVIPILLFSCAQPKTTLPKIEKSDIEAEKAYQEEYLYKNDFSYIYDAPPTKRTMEKRLSRISKRVGPAAIKLCNELRVKDKSGNKRRCLFHVELGKADDDSYNAFADGHKLVLSRKLVQLVRKDEQLAFIMAHEFAHNIMGHLDDQVNNMTGGAIVGILLDATMAGLGANTQGGFTKIGAQMAAQSFSTDYEHEADYVGLYIASRAGYKVNKAAEVWRLMSAVNPDSIYTSTTHPTSPERFVMMNKIVDEISEKKRSKQALLPEMKIDNPEASDDKSKSSLTKGRKG